MNYSLKEFATLCGGTLCDGSDGSRSFDYIESDSRQVSSNSTLFAAFKGDNFDGHSFVADMCKNGGAVIDNPAYACPNAILTPNVKAALYKAAYTHRRERLPATRVLAVTGSVGKTTVKNMAYLVMSSHFDTYKSKGNRNSLTGLPMEILDMPETATHAVLEAGMSEPGEIAKISELILPEAAIVTTIGHSHIEAFGTVEAICEEKLSIASAIKSKSLVLSAEPLLLMHKKSLPNAVYCSATDTTADAYAENISTSDGVTRFTANFAGEKQNCILPAMGLHNVQNALLCIVAGVRLGVPMDKAAASLENFAAEGFRQNIRTTNGITVIADCYNASPESMKAALGVLKDGKGKRIAVLGDMLELGAHSKSLHETVGAVAAEAADILICVGNEAKYIADTAKECGADTVIYYANDSWERAAEQLRDLVESGDTVLFKASNRTCVRKIMEKSAI